MDLLFKLKQIHLPLELLDVSINGKAGWIVINKFTIKEIQSKQNKVIQF